MKINWDYGILIRTLLTSCDNIKWTAVLIAMLNSCVIITLVASNAYKNQGLVQRYKYLL